MYIFLKSNFFCLECHDFKDKKQRSLEPTHIAMDYYRIGRYPPYYSGGAGISELQP